MRRTMRNCYPRIFLLVVTAAACSGQRVLDESHAKELIVQSIQSNDGFLGSASKISPLMARSMNDYATMTTEEASPEYMLQRLMKEHLVTQSTIREEYPDLSGTWTGGGGSDRYPERYRMELTQRAGSNEITGTCEHEAYGQTWQTTVGGFVQPGGSVTLTAARLKACLGVYGEQNYQYSENGESSSLFRPHDDKVVVRSGVPPKVAVMTYEYAFTPEVRVLPHGVEFGHYEIGDVSNLQLDGETRARASFSWRVTLNKLGTLMLNREVVGNGNAVFAKKPDGTWVLAEQVHF